MNSYPLRHLSIRVPWHDSAWDGRICNKPHLNGACAKLTRIAEHKDEETERQVAGKKLNVLPIEQWPCCVHERAMFMAPFELVHDKRHALAIHNPTHYGHFLPTPQRYPAFSAGVVPFSWMMTENLEKRGEALALDVDSSREPDLGYHSSWVHEARNQTELLDAFANHLRQEDSLCLFYAKHVPFVEGTRRILVGAGRIKDIGRLAEFRRSDRELPRGMVWERPIQHSIRPNENDGFLFPYHQLLLKAAESPSIDLEQYTAFAPSEHWDEFSYGSEHVTHDAAISALLSLENALNRINCDFGIATEKQQQWIHDELVRLWKVRGPFPGLGAVLHAFGLSQGVFVAHEIQRRAGENTDPWPIVDAVFQDPSVLPEGLRRDVPELSQTWSGLPEERRRFLRLLSRFEINVKQACDLYEENSRRKKGWNATDKEILQNPYRVYEISRLDRESINLLTIDRGIFPDDSVRIRHPLESPSGLDSALDIRRVRAFAISALEEASLGGHTLQAVGELGQKIRDTAVRPECPVTSDILYASVNSMSPEVVKGQADGEMALQLGRYNKIGDIVRKNVRRRISGKRHTVDIDWNMRVSTQFSVSLDDSERRAREEKAKSLELLAESRFSILAGSAGTGKTSVLGLLCVQDEIRRNGLLLLAPTGKARVRMQQLAGEVDTQALTIAQFLTRHGRYDGSTGRYHLSDRPKAKGYGTVVIDEASMLTEDMLGALLDALHGVERLILAGDPSQLPPIGAGRPFVDIISELRPDDIETRFPRVSKGYAELTVDRRQIGTERPDRRLAKWFSTSPPTAGEDDIFSVDDNNSSTLRFVEWEQSEDFQSKLLGVLAEELKLAGPIDLIGFNRAMGATRTGDYDYFNATRNEDVGAVKETESWQILSPLRGMPFGVGDINRQIHERFRTNFIDLASRDRNRLIPKPLGPERIVYGDKVINLRNHIRDGRQVYPPEGAMGYVANGEIGVVVGQFRKWAPKLLKVEFASQIGHTYDFNKRDFSEESDPVLELAYALTIHKAQGSQFGLVIVVLPEGHPILSRELIYTALTRHQDRIVVMHQGPRSHLKEFAAPHRSETARRKTNLLTTCLMLEFPRPQGSVFMQAGLVHRTSKGLAVRSKSELLIAEALGSAGVDFEYEKPLTLGGCTRYPDFTIEDEFSGRIVYWEHLGMLDHAEYSCAWKKKLKWYRDYGVIPIDEDGNGDAVLIQTTDSTETGLDMSQVNELIAKVCGD